MWVVDFVSTLQLLAGIWEAPWRPTIWASRSFRFENRGPVMFPSLSSYSNWYPNAPQKCNAYQLLLSLPRNREPRIGWQRLLISPLKGKLNVFDIERANNSQSALHCTTWPAVQVHSTMIPVPMSTTLEVCVPYLRSRTSAVRNCLTFVPL
jgi:hypothetical protein